MDLPLPASAIRALERALRAQYPERAWSVVPAEDNPDAAGDRRAAPLAGPLDDDTVDQAT
jgi:hypothetical protein